MFPPKKQSAKNNSKKNDTFCNPKEKKKSLTEEEFEEMKRRFAKVSPEERQSVASEIAGAMFYDVRDYARYIIGSDSQKIQPSSVAVLSFLKASGYLGRKETLDSFESVKKLTSFLKKIVFSAMIDKYRELNGGKKARRNGVHIIETSSLSSQDEDSSDFDPLEPGSFTDIVMEAEIADKFLNLLRKYLEPQDVDLLISRFENGMTYPDIVEVLCPDQTPDQVRHRVNALLIQLANIGQIRTFGQENNLNLK